MTKHKTVVLHEAIVQVMLEHGAPMRGVDAYQAIVKADLYEFDAAQPKKIVARELWCYREGNTKASAGSKARWKLVDKDKKLYWPTDEPIQEFRLSHQTINQNTVKQPSADETQLKNTSSERVVLQDAERDHEPNLDTSCNPQEYDRQELVYQQIRKRRGQQQFRDALRERYGNRCVVTGCNLLAVLEAAHIDPYRGENDNHPENGLLLRADIHTLFDLDLLSIEPDQMHVELHPNLLKDVEYGKLAGKTLSCCPDKRPSHQALNLRYE